MATVTVPSELGLGDGNIVELRKVIPSHDLAEQLTRSIVQEICRDREIEHLIRLGERDIEHLVNEAILNAELPASVKVTFVSGRLEGFSQSNLPGYGIFIANLKEALFTAGARFDTGDIHPLFDANGKQTHLEYNSPTNRDKKPNYTTNKDFFTSPTVILSGGESEEVLTESGRKLFVMIKNIFGRYFNDFILPFHNADLNMKRRVEKSLQVVRLAEAQRKENIVDMIDKLPGLLGRDFNNEKWGEIISVLRDARLLLEPSINQPWRTGGVIVMDRIRRTFYRVLPVFTRRDNGELRFTHKYRTVEVDVPDDQGEIIDEPWNEKGLLTLASFVKPETHDIAIENLQITSLSPETLLETLRKLEEEYMDSTVKVVQGLLSSILARKRAELVRK